MRNLRLRPSRADIVGLQGNESARKRVADREREDRIAAWIRRVEKRSRCIPGGPARAIPYESEEQSGLRKGCIWPRWWSRRLHRHTELRESDCPNQVFLAAVCRAVLRAGLLQKRQLPQCNRALRYDRDLLLTPCRV